MTTLDDSDVGLDFLQFSYMSARDWLEQNFESEEMKAFLALWTNNHSPISPEEPRGALVALGFVGSLQDAGVGIPVGGVQTLVNAFRVYIESHGGELHTSSEVVQIILNEKGEACAAKTKDGSVFHARRGAIANVEAKSLFSKLVSENALDSDFHRKVRSFRFSTVSEVMIHAALDEWLNYMPEELKKSGIWFR